MAANFDKSQDSSSSPEQEYQAKGVSQPDEEHYQAKGVSANNEQQLHTGIVDPTAAPLPQNAGQPAPPPRRQIVDPTAAPFPQNAGQPSRVSTVTPGAWNLQAVAPTRSTTPQPAKPTLNVKLRLDAPDISAEELNVFLTETLPLLRLDFTKVGASYKFQLDLETELRRTVGEKAKFQFELCDVDAGFERLGLRCALDRDRRVLVFEGTPKERFDGFVALQFECRLLVKSSLKLTSAFSLVGRKTTLCVETCEADPVNLQFLIHPDPWSLWNTLEPPVDAPYPTSHSEIYAARFPQTDKLVLAASQRGRSHEHDGKFRDDSFAVKLDAIDGWSFFAVGDGAGSAKFSRKGSEIACKTVVERLAHYFQTDADSLNSAIEQFQSDAAQAPERAVLDGNDAPPTVVNIFHRALYETFLQLHNEVKTRNQNCALNETTAQMRDYHTTLLCCALKKFASGWVVLSYWVGDGGFAVYRPNGEERALALGVPDGGEFAGQTRFFTMKEEIDAAPIKNRVRVAFVSDFDALVLATDGVSDPYFEVENDLLAFERWRAFWQARAKDELFHGVFDDGIDIKERAERLKQGLRFKIAGHHDDRTILLVLNPDAFATPCKHAAPNPPIAPPSLNDDQLEGDR